MNDSGGVYTPEEKVKRFLDSVAYCLLLGYTDGIETEYKKAMHSRREIPASNCPTFIENMIYATGGTTDAIDRDECVGFQVMLDELDERTERHVAPNIKKEHAESRFHKRNRLGIRGGEWCNVDTDGVFEYRGRKYRIDPDEEQYQPKATEFGDQYDMDRILVVDVSANRFYDMAFNEVRVNEI